MSAIKRVAQLMETRLNQSTSDIDFADLKQCASRIQFASSSQLTWHDIARYSNRQGKHIPMGGLLGQVQLIGKTDDLKWLIPYLWQCQWLNIGKETGMGLGVYQITHTK
jgi:CRISPR/Cas system endoribonuclease Cas6 (RAMP superfamily)